MINMSTNKNVLCNKIVIEVIKMVSKKTMAELYQENTSHYTKIYNLLFRLDILVFPFLILGTFLRNDSVIFLSLTF